MKRIGASFTVLFMISCYLSACAVHPVTLEKQFMIISEEKEISIGKRSDPVILQQFGFYDDPALQEYVNEVGQKLPRRDFKKIGSGFGARALFVLHMNICYNRSK